MNPPLVSVLIPAWNRERYIEAAVRSALAQTMGDLEVIVSDNASTDNTCSIVEMLAREDARVRLIRQEKNLGPVANWRACAAAARGKYAKILWSDDVDAPEFLRRATEALEANPSAKLYLTNASLINSSGAVERTNLYRFPEKSGTIPSQKMLFWMLATQRMPVSPGCALMPLDVLRKGLTLAIPTLKPGPADRHGVGPDIMTLLWAALCGQCVVLDDQPLACFRAHPGSITVSSRERELQVLYLVAKSAFVGTCKNQMPRRLVLASHGVHRLMLARLKAGDYLGVDGLAKIDGLRLGVSEWTQACVCGMAICLRERAQHHLLQAAIAWRAAMKIAARK